MCSRLNSHFGKKFENCFYITWCFNMKFPFVDVHFSFGVYNIIHSSFPVYRVIHRSAIKNNFTIPINVYTPTKSWGCVIDESGIRDGRYSSLNSNCSAFTNKPGIKYKLFDKLIEWSVIISLVRGNGL